MIARVVKMAGIAAIMTIVVSGAAQACPSGSGMAGVVQRVDGGNDDVGIQRAGAGSIRPVPMQILCEGDVLSAKATASITYRLEGASSSAVLRGPSQVQLPRTRRGGAVMDNALDVLMQNWMPDLRQSATYGTARGAQPGSATAEWGIPGLDTGAATIRRGSRSLYVRWLGGMDPFEVQLLNKEEKVLERVRTREWDIRFSPRRWANGIYLVRVYAVSGAEGAKSLLLAGSFRVGDNPANYKNAYPAALGAELQTASAALRLASEDRQRWSLEAFQMIDTAPAQGLDREAIYRTLDRDVSGTSQP